jgi:hypothetical protein
MKIALVQFYSYHEEVLAPQINFLLPDNELYIAAPKDVFSNDYIKPFHNGIKKILFSSRKYNSRLIYTVPFRIFSILYKYFQFHSIVKRENIQLIIFNTINKHFHFKLIRFYFRHIDKIHIIHNAQLFTTEKTIKSLAMFKKNLFISQDVLNHYQKEFARFGVKNIDWFFPGLSSLISSKEDAKNYCKNKIVIVVPGSVDNSRRNYKGLFDALEKLDGKEPVFQIILLGKISHEYQREIRRTGGGGGNSILKTYDEYVPGEEMLQTIKYADAIAFLVDKNIGDNCQLYNRYKASGTSVLCLSFGIPCIVSSDFSIDSSLKDRSIVYPGSNIHKIFADILNGGLTKDYFTELKRKPLPIMYSTDFQRSHYRKILGI